MLSSLVFPRKSFLFVGLSFDFFSVFLISTKSPAIGFFFVFITTVVLPEETNVLLGDFILGLGGEPGLKTLGLEGELGLITLGDLGLNTLGLDEGEGLEGELILGSEVDLILEGEEIRGEDDLMFEGDLEEITDFIEGIFGIDLILGLEIEDCNLGFGLV